MISQSIRALIYVAFSILVLFFITMLACTGDDDDDGGDFDCNDGACADAQTNLMWEALPGEPLTYDQAEAYCENLSLAGHDDWQVPIVDDLRSLIRGCPDTELGGACLASSDCYQSGECLTPECDGCDENGPPNGYCYWISNLPGGCEEWYWSSTPTSDTGTGRWGVDYHKAEVELLVTGEHANLVRCVRSDE